MYFLWETQCSYVNKLNDTCNVPARINMEFWTQLFSECGTCTTFLLYFLLIRASILITIPFMCLKSCD